MIWISALTHNKALQLLCCYEWLMQSFRSKYILKYYQEPQPSVVNAQAIPNFVTIYLQCFNSNEVAIMLPFIHFMNMNHLQDVPTIFDSNYFISLSHWYFRLLLVMKKIFWIKVTFFASFLLNKRKRIFVSKNVISLWMLWKGNAHFISFPSQFRLMNAFERFFTVPCLSCTYAFFASW